MCVCCCGSGAAGVAWAAWLAHAVWALESLPCPYQAMQGVVRFIGNFSAESPNAEPLATRSSAEATQGATSSA